ncbi:hypothetical protein ES332_D04G077500v1 [Gossypium tomentosum]|uniref:NAC domain-containing protein n=1 Tax=Gossypium tomentosum TaxID=34277 RepID=A0A5D2LB35_GOSTO|nr:hypothetical protein ES332_D04G077500v1 [Gossypium tomentosum]
MSINKSAAMEEDGNQELMVRMKEAEDEAYLKSMPSGFRFKPRDDELIFYLMCKARNKPLPPTRIKEVPLYKYDPDTLTAISGNMSSNGTINEWYFFTSRDRKHPQGKRPNRAAGDGFWKAVNSDKHVKSNGKLIGLKKTLVYCRGKPSKAQKTNWIMHEYVLSDPPQTTHKNGHQIDGWALCRVYNRKPQAPKVPEKSSPQNFGSNNLNIENQIKEQSALQNFVTEDLNFSESDKFLLYANFGTIIYSL